MAVRWQGSKALFDLSVQMIVADTIAETLDVLNELTVALRVAGCARRGASAAAKEIGVKPENITGVHFIC
jgi:hypothetical protein